MVSEVKWCVVWESGEWVDEVGCCVWGWGWSECVVEGEIVIVVFVVMGEIGEIGDSPYPGMGSPIGDLTVSTSFG